MDAVTRKSELRSIALLAAAFVIFTIAIPLLQDSIDTTNEHYTDYKFNLQQSSLNHGKFITTHDNAHFLEILLQEKIVTEKQKVAAALKIRDRLGLRCQELLADAIMAASVDPSDEAGDAVTRHRRLRHTELGELIKEWDKYVGPSPTKIGHEFVEELRAKNRWKVVLYCLGSILFIVGTFLQVSSKGGELPKPVLPNQKERQKGSKDK